MLERAGPPAATGPRLRVPRFLRGGVLALALGLGAAAGAAASPPCTYYAAPVREDGGRVPEGEPYAMSFAVGTPDKPIPVSDFWARKLVKPGTVLCLKDGEYRGARSMIDPTPGRFAGEAGARVVVRAMHDGRVWIDGEFERAPLRLKGHDYWTVEGLNLYNSRGSVVGVAGLPQTEKSDQVPTHHVVLRRLVAWRDYLPYGSQQENDPIGGANVHVYDLADVSDVLLEDCAGFGWARKVFQNYRSKRVVMRRDWARWDGRHPYKGGNKFAFACSYTAYDALCENLIATVGSVRDSAAQPDDYQPAVYLIATDGVRTGMRWLEPRDRDRFDLGLRILGSLAYVPPESHYQRVTGFLLGGITYPSKGIKGVLMADSVSAVGTPAKTAAVLNDCDDDPQQHPDGCSWLRHSDRARAPLRLEHVTLIAARKRRARLGKDWLQEDVQTRSWNARGDVYRGSSDGASLCHRWVDGRETAAPLWPWPMQERIRQATQRSTWQAADVMGEISALFGPPPPECSASAEEAAPE